MSLGADSQDERYQNAVAAFGPAIERLAGAYEANGDARSDLLQDIHIALWRSLKLFDGRCSLRTWIYRVAHNTAASYAIKQARRRPERLASLDELERLPDDDNPETSAGRRHAAERLMRLIHQLGPPDRQIMLLYLEDIDAATIGEITGLSANAVATKIHRLKSLLAKHFNLGGTYVDDAS